jgi:hypothetical protein
MVAHVLLTHLILQWMGYSRIRQSGCINLHQLQEGQKGSLYLYFTLLMGITVGNFVTS